MAALPLHILRLARSSAYIRSDKPPLLGLSGNHAGGVVKGGLNSPSVPAAGWIIEDAGIGAMKWFRLYDELVDDPKVQLLSLELFRALINLWCVASQNNGVLPALEHVAIKLRMKPAKARSILAQLRTAGFIDEDESGLSPHNWKGRQWLSSDSSAERVRRHRARRAEAGLVAQWTPPKALKAALYERDNYQCCYCGAESDLCIDHKTPELRGGSHDLDNLQILCRVCNAAKRDMAHEEYIVWDGRVTLQKRPQKTDTEQIQKTEDPQQHSPETVAAPARGQSLVSPEAFAIADEISQSLGFTKETWPIGWHGAPMAIQKWLNDGCPGEVVKLAVTTALGRKRDGPPENFSYFAKPIAAAFANHQRPNPTAPPQVFDGRTNGKPPAKRTVIDAANDLVAKLDALDGEAQAGSGTSAPPIRLLPPH